MATPPTTIPGKIPWAERDESARGWHASLSPYPNDVMNRALKWALLASGYDPDADPFYFDRTYTIDVSKRSEANFGLKLQAAHDLLPSTGGVLDCQGLVGAQVLSSNVNITKPGVTIKFGACSITTAGFQFLVSSTAHGIQLLGANPFSYNATISSSGGTFIYHNTGSLASLVLGDGAAKLYGVKLADLYIHCQDASDDVGVVGVWVKRVQSGHYENIIVSCGGTKYNQSCFRIDGTAGATFYHTLINCLLANGGKGLHLTGVGVNACNALTMLGGSLNGSVGGFRGLVIDADGNGNQFLGVDIANCLVGVTLSGAAKNNKIDCRFEGNTTDATFASGCTDNWIQGSGLNTVTDSDGSNTIIKQNTAGTTQITFGRDFTAIGGFRQVVDGWFQDNVPGTQSNVELTRSVGRFRAIRAGSVTGVIVTATEARTAGTLTVDVYKNTGLSGAAGSSIGLTAVLDGTNTSRKATTQAKDVDTFAAGDEIYVVITTSSWTPTTSDVRVAIEVES